MIFQSWLATIMTVDESLLEQVRKLFAEQAEYMKTRGKRGDRLIFSFRNPNYMLFTYDNVVFQGEDSSMRPTRTEVWAKALYAAMLIQLLVGARVYITDKPYLTFTRPEEMKTIIEMEGLPPLFSGLFPISLDTERSETSIQRATESSARLPLGALSAVLDLLAAVWEITRLGKFMAKAAISAVPASSLQTRLGAFNEHETHQQGIIHPLLTWNDLPISARPVVYDIIANALPSRLIEHAVFTGIDSGWSPYLRHLSNKRAYA